jgi:hypothetical protein
MIDERINSLFVKKLQIGMCPIAKSIVGTETVTGTATVTCPVSDSAGVIGIQTITGVQVSLNGAPVTGAASVSATWSGLTVTISVWTSTFTASAVATPVTYTISGY